jgi:hypothetical protein
VSRADRAVQGQACIHMVLCSSNISGRIPMMWQGDDDVAGRTGAMRDSGQEACSV